MQRPLFPSSITTILSQMLQKHEVVTLTTYITNFILTDSWKGTTSQFLIHFIKKPHLLDSLVPDTDMIPETVRITLLQRAVQKNHGARPIHVLESVSRSKTGSTGKFTFEDYYSMTYSGMQHINMTSTMLQDTRKAKLSFPSKLIHLMNLALILVRTLQLIKKRMILPHFQFCNLLSILLNLKNVLRFYP